MDARPHERKPLSIQASQEDGTCDRAASEKRSADRDGASHYESGRHQKKVMNYAIAIEYQKGKCHGVEIPDLPGCFSAGDTLDAAIENARDAASFHIEGLLDAGLPVPEPAGVEAYAGRKEYAGRTWALISVDLAALSGRARRLNITLPERVLRRIDVAAARSGESRSGFIARAALEAV